MFIYFKKDKGYGRKLEGNEIRIDKEISDIKVSIYIGYRLCLIIFGQKMELKQGKYDKFRCLNILDVYL